MVWSKEDRSLERFGDLEGPCDSHGNEVPSGYGMVAEARQARSKGASVLKQSVSGVSKSELYCKAKEGLT